MRTHVDLFSGIGGFPLACEWAGVETIAFSEVDSYASRVLQRHWPNVRNYGDVRNFPSLSAWLLTAGVPCQPASVAGKRQGAADDRWLWPETLAVVENGSYEWLLFENPTGILSLNDGLEFERICAALEGQGYEVQPLVIPACGVGALHRRNRIWILGHATGQRLHAAAFNRIRCQQEGAGSRDAELKRRGSDVAHTDGSERGTDAERRSNEQNRSDAGRKEASSGSSVRGHYVSDANGAGLAERSRQANGCRVVRYEGQTITRGDWWAIEPDVGRVANGIPARVDRLRCLGNAIVPQVAYQLIKRMIEAEERSAQ